MRSLVQCLEIFARSLQKTCFNQCKDAKTPVLFLCFYTTLSVRIHMLFFKILINSGLKLLRYYN